MKFVLRAAIAAMSIGSIPPAMAGGGGPNPNTFSTELPGVVAQAPAQNGPSIEATQHGQAVQTYTQSGRGPWLVPPIGKYLDLQARG
jgi:hypothetical protein